MTIWLPDYEVIDVLGDGGSYEADQDPYRIVLHTTQGASIEGAVGVYQQKLASPHITADWTTRRKAQHLPLDVAAYALVNLAGGVETNREHAIQVELVGFAAETPDWPEDALAFVAAVIADIRAAVPGIPLQGPAFVGEEAGYIAREDAPQRMTFDQWRTFAGVCGHQHVPENAHWDPGHLNIDRVFALAGGAAATPTDEEFTVSQYSEIMGKLDWLLSNAGQIRGVEVDSVSGQLDGTCYIHRDLQGLITEFRAFALLERGQNAAVVDALAAVREELTKIGQTGGSVDATKVVADISKILADAFAAASAAAQP